MTEAEATAVVSNWCPAGSQIDIVRLSHDREGVTIDARITPPQSDREPVLTTVRWAG